MKYSGFVFCHNYSAGYPIRQAVQAIGKYCDDVVAVDCASTDGTREVLESLGCRIIDGEWGTEAETTLGKAHALHTECRHETVIHFEADEVWGDDLIAHVAASGVRSAIVHRIQIDQNFQRLRWAAHPVHRVFQRGFATKDPARGHTTKEHDSVIARFSPDEGLIWDCSYVFRDQYRDRMLQNAKLWGETPQSLRRTPEHFLEKPFAEDLDAFLAEPQWTWKRSPFDLPESLKKLVGVPRYE